MSDITTAALDVLAGAPEVGRHFTCSEIEALAALLCDHGRRSDAASLLWGHADEDEKGDQHHQWTEADCTTLAARLAPTIELPPFPILPGSDECPACHLPGTLQAAEETTRYWRGFSIDEAGAVMVYDDTTYDDGDNPRIDCTVCGASWALPEEVEYG